MNSYSNHLFLTIFFVGFHMLSCTAQAQTTTQTQTHQDPSGITATMQVGLSNNIPKTLRYELKNTAPTDQTVWLPKDKAYIREFVRILHGGETLETAYPRAIILSSQSSPLAPTATILAPDESITWSFEIVDLLKNKTEFQAIDSFERFGISIRFPYLIANPDANITTMESRTGISLRWRWQQV